MSELASIEAVENLPQTGERSRRCHERLVRAHLVAISGGKDSTAMALRLAEVEPNAYEFCITPTGRELPEMLDHYKRLECLLGKPLTRIPAPTLLEKIIEMRCLPNSMMRWCTRLIKIEPFMKYAASHAPAICYVGIRADETDDRSGTNWNGIENVVQDLPLSRWGWGINRVREYLRERGIEIPERTDCDCCFFQQLGEWWRLWRDHKDIYQELEALEIWVGHTFRSPSRDTWPASLKELRLKFEAGYIPKGAADQKLRLDVSERPTMCAWCAR